MEVEAIQSAIAELPENKFAALEQWFDAYRADAWDAQIARDADSGRLDALLSEIDAGLAKPL